LDRHQYRGYREYAAKDESELKTSHASAAFLARAFGAGFAAFGG
jgi:hypothetical protein